MKATNEMNELYLNEKEDWNTRNMKTDALRYLSNPNALTHFCMQLGNLKDSIVC